MCIFFPSEYILTTVSSTEREQQPKKKKYSQFVVGRAVYAGLFVSLGVGEDDWRENCTGSSEI